MIFFGLITLGAALLVAGAWHQVDDHPHDFEHPTAVKVMLLIIFASCIMCGWAAYFISRGSTWW